MTFAEYLETHPNGAYADFVAFRDECDRAVDWITTDLPTMRAIVRAEFPNMTRAEVAIEAIRRLG